MTVYIGNILTVDANDSVVHYLVEDGGKILYTGNELPPQYEGKPVITLGQRVLIPAFADTHQHFASFSILHAGLNVMNAASNNEIMDMLRDYARQCPDKLLIAFGASANSVREHTLITRKQLDSVCDNRPILMVKYDGHACIVNTPLLRKIQDKIETLPGYYPLSGEMNQEAFFSTIKLITGYVSLPQLWRCMQSVQDYEARKGIGMIHTVSGVGFPLNMDIRCETRFAKSCTGHFQIRVFPQSMKPSVAISHGLPRIGGCFACALDGCLGSQNAAMKTPYQSEPESCGTLYYSDEQVSAFCKEANRLELQIEMHAIGDRAFDQAAKALKAALDDMPRSNHRHGIIHACLPTEEGLDICSQYGIHLPMQIAFDNWRQEPAEYTNKLLGEERSRCLNPLRKIADRGIRVSFGSDAPCTDPDPVLWLHKAVNHSNPDSAVSIQQALRMATYNGYYASFDETERGSLETGKIADMVMLSDNPYTLPKEELQYLKVERLYLSGKEYETSTQASSPMQILSGLVFPKNKA